MAPSSRGRSKCQSIHKYILRRRLLRAIRSRSCGLWSGITSRAIYILLQCAVCGLTLLYHHQLHVVHRAGYLESTAIMAHIAAFMADADLDIPNSVGLNNYIAREISPAPSAHETVRCFVCLHDHITNNIQSDAPEGKEKEKEKGKHVWRMHQPSGSRKLHLFPSREKLSIGSAGRKSPDTTNEAAGQAVGRNASEDKEQSRSRSSSKEPKPKEQSLVRRRKVSVPELGPMTTVQEVAMDSRKLIYPSHINCVFNGSF